MQAMPYLNLRLHCLRILLQHRLMFHQAVFAAYHADIVLHLLIWGLFLQARQEDPVTFLLLKRRFLKLNQAAEALLLQAYLLNK